MITSISSIPANSQSLHETFLALLPKIETHAKISFRHIRCASTKADKVAEAVALAWNWFLRLHERGKDINDFRMVFTFLVVKAVKSGRRVTGTESIKDALSERAQRRHRFKVEALPTSTRASHEARFSKPHAQVEQDILEERLRDNVATPPPDAAAFRIDFPQWRSGQSERDRKLIDLLMLDTRTQDVAKKFAVSSGRVSQKRRQLHDDWQRFHGEDVTASQRINTA